MPAALMSVNRVFLLPTILLLLAFGCSRDANSGQNEKPLTAADQPEKPSGETGKDKSAPPANSGVKFPSPVLSSARPIIAADLFPPKDVDGLRFDVRVSGKFPLLRQDKTNACWATAAAMLDGWKKDRKVLTSDYLAGLGGPYLSIYVNNRGLHRDEKEAFLKRAGLSFEWGASYLPEGITDLLKQHGPLWFTISNGTEWSQHATVIVGLFGTGDIKSTYIAYADPADGQEHALLYPDFMKVYEDVAWEQNSIKDYDEGFQVVHYP
jgi:Papain-like cysteine protease AvrRpt2